MIDFAKTRTLGQFVKNVSLAYGAKTALVWRPRFRKLVYSYNKLYRYSLTLAAILAKNQIGKGDKVLIWAPNSPHWVAAFFATLIRGAVVVPISVENQPDFVKKIIAQTEAKLLIKSQFLPTIKTRTLIVEELEQFPISMTGSQTKIGQNDLAEIVYTSGTTGDPKGVILTHQNILANVSSTLQVIPLTDKDRSLSILPLSHMFEQVAGMLIPLSVGAQITYPAAINSIEVSKNMIEDKVTKLVAVPEFLKLIIKRIEGEAEKSGKKVLLENLFKIAKLLPAMWLRRILVRPILKKFGGQLDTIASGGAALDETIGQKWEALGIYVLQGYGTTETSPVVCANSYRGRKIASVGKPVPGVGVKIAKDGEILVKGISVTQGYFKNLQKTKESFEGSWYKTGDLGKFDADGHLYILGRKKYLIVTEAGLNVYPEDLEFELNKEAAVADSTVVGLAVGDKTIIHAVLLGEKIKNPQNLIQRVNARLASYQQIQDWSIWPFADFPRTVTRKVKKDEVIKFLEGQEKLPTAKEKIKTDQITQIIALITGLPAAQITDKQKLVADLKMDSLERVELVSLIELQTGVIIDESAIGYRTTVKDVKEKVQHKIQKTEKHQFHQWPLSQPVASLRKFAQKLLLFPVTNYFAKIEVHGKGNLANLKLPALICANHLSAIDPAVIIRSLPGQIRQRLAIASAADLLFDQGKYAKWGGLLTFLFNIYHFARSGQIRSSLEYTGRLLDRSFSILVFPEGRVSTSGRLQPFKDGVGFLAVEMQVPTVPLKIAGTPKIIAPGVELPCWPKKGNVTVKIGKPLIFEPDDSYIEATKLIEQALKKL